MKRTSLADIAKSLSVSKTLVSMVLNDRGDENGISPLTQKKVRAKAKELNYRPNQIARNLRLGRSNTLGLIVSDISNQFYSTISRSVEDVASKHGYHMMFCSSDENPKKEMKLIDMLKNYQTDGLIISSSQLENNMIHELIAEGYPFVLIDRYIPGIEANTVTIDNRQGAFDMVSHMVHQGHKNIALLRISPSHLTTINDRYEGYKAALKHHKLPFQEDLIKEIPYDDIKNSIYRTLDELLADGKTDALFALNNNLATACLEYFADKNIDVPTDIAIASFDDIDVFRFSNPPMSAVAQPVEQIGEEAVKLLLELIKLKGKQDKPKQIVLPTTLVIRKSCKE